MQGQLSWGPKLLTLILVVVVIVVTAFFLCQSSTRSGGHKAASLPLEDTANAAGYFPPAPKVALEELKAWEKPFQGVIFTVDPAAKVSPHSLACIAQVKEYGGTYTSVNSAADVLLADEPNGCVAGRNRQGNLVLYGRDIRDGVKRLVSQALPEISSQTIENPGSEDGQALDLPAKTYLAFVRGQEQTPRPETVKELKAYLVLRTLLPGIVNTAIQRSQSGYTLSATREEALYLLTQDWLALYTSAWNIASPGEREASLGKLSPGDMYILGMCVAFPSGAAPASPAPVGPLSPSELLPVTTTVITRERDFGDSAGAPVNLQVLREALEARAKKLGIKIPPDFKP